jgi:hypothetical protein
MVERIIFSTFLTKIIHNNLSLVLLHLFKSLNDADGLNNYSYPHSSLLMVFAHNLKTKHKTERVKKA